MTQAVEKFHHREDVEVARAVALFRNSPRLVAASFAQKDGSIDWGAVELACATALDWNLSPLANAHLLPVINNRVYPMAEVCRTLAGRAGWNIDILEDTVDACTGIIWRGDRKPPALTITLAEAKKMGSAPKNPNYETDARAMLRAKVSRRLVTLYCPEVLAGTPPERVAWEDDPRPGPGALGEVPPGPELVDDADRAYLTDYLARLADHHPELHRWLRNVWKAFDGPALAAPAFSVEDGRRLRLLLQAPTMSGPAPAGFPPPAKGAPPRVAPAGPDVVPSALYDASPESRNFDEAQPASYEDPDEDYGRPFGDDE